MHRRSLAIILVLALPGCGVLPAVPLSSQVITGDFGGDNVLMSADSTGARIDHGCSRIIVPSPLTTDAHGAFSLSAVRRRNGGVAPLPEEMPTAVRVDGRATSDDGGTVRLIITNDALRGGTSVGLNDTLLVTRGRKGTIFACP